jgi:protein SHQ1
MFVVMQSILNGIMVLDLATSTQTRDLYLTLVTLLFSYAYDARFTQHDPSTESAWTISALTPAFSALDPPPYTTGIHSASIPAHGPIFTPSEVASTLVPSYRRSLAFPLYRSFALAEACRADVAELLCKGRRTVVRCLLELKCILDHHEVYYVYSKIWVEDFCVWTQAYATFVYFYPSFFLIAYYTTDSDDNLKRLATCVKFLKMEKSLLGWDLEKLEGVTQRLDSDDETDG